MKKKTVINRIVSLAVTVLMLVPILASFPVKADTATKKQKSYDIAIAFDNSGSMYDDQSWCRAKYAMEIFASMLDYESGDRLRIFPMWEVTTDGSKPNPYGTLRESSAPIVIKSKHDIDKISNMYTIQASDTPFTPVTNAFDYLQTSTATDKWLIVLSDGEFNGAEKDAEVLRSRLLAMAKSGNINVQYLGFAEAGEVRPDEAHGLYAKKSTDVSLMIDLVEICNAIFQRSILGKEYYNNGSLSFDLSMNKVIVFVQGEGARIDSLKNSNGQIVKILQDSEQRKYSEMSVGRFYKDMVPPIDDTLYGQVVTFDACPKGTYTLNCPGAEEVQIFYEPNVDIKVSLVNSEGEEVDISTDGIEAGEYTISSIIVDGVTGEDVTNHKLMGKDGVKFTTYVKKSGESDYTRYENGATINFEPDDKTEVIVEATYLEDYVITTKGDPTAFPFPLLVKTPRAKFNAELTPQQDNGDYKLLDYKGWKPIKAVITLDGQPLSPEEMQNLKADMSLNSGVPCYAEILADESACLIYVGKNQNGEYDLPDVGEHTLEFGFTYTDRYGDVYTDKGSVNAKFICDLAVEAVVEQEDSWYTITDHEDWEPIKLKVSIDGNPLTEEQLNALKTSIEFDDDITWHCEVNPDDSSIDIYIGYDENGDFKEPGTGRYKLNAGVTLTDEFGHSFTDAEKIPFDIQRYSKTAITLFWIGLFLLALVIWLLYMSQKVLPKGMVKDTASLETMSAGDLGGNYVNVEYRRKSRSLKITTTGGVDFDEKCTATFKLKPVDTRFVKSKDRRVKIVGVNSNCISMQINHIEYVKNARGVWVKATASELPNPPPIACEARNPTFDLFRGSEASIVSTLTCRVKNK